MIQMKEKKNIYKILNERVKKDLDKALSFRNAIMGLKDFNSVIDSREKQEKEYNKIMFFKQLKEVIGNDKKD